jgi:hypothetical protein
MRANRLKPVGQRLCCAITMSHSKAWRAIRINRQLLSLIQSWCRMTWQAGITVIIECGVTVIPNCHRALALRVCLSDGGLTGRYATGMNAYPSLLRPLCRCLVDLGERRLAKYGHTLRLGAT